MNLLKRYQKLGFVLVALKPGTKNPYLPAWNKLSTSDPIRTSDNIGLKHAFSGLCCLDIDDLKKLKKALSKKQWHQFTCGIKYTSGKKNRLKVLFRLPKGAGPFLTVNLPSGSGQVRCADGNEDSVGSVQDAVPLQNSMTAERTIGLILYPRTEKTYHACQSYLKNTCVNN